MYIRQWNKSTSIDVLLAFALGKMSNSNITAECLQQVCGHLAVCLEEYYRQSNFLFEQRLWAWTYLFCPFITMMYCQDPWLSFGTAFLLMTAEELTMAISVWIGKPIFLIGAWEPGDIALTSFYGIAGVSTAMVFIYCLDIPRLIRSPYEELNIIARDYGRESLASRETLKEILYEHSKWSYRWLRWKYLFQMGIVQAIAFGCFIAVPNAQDQNLPRHGAGHLDWILFTSINYAFFLVLYFWNWSSKIEKTQIWRNNVTHYNIFSLSIVTVFTLIVLPGVYFVWHAKLSIFLSLGAILVCLLALGLLHRSCLIAVRAPILSLASEEFEAAEEYDDDDKDQQLNSTAKRKQ